MKVAIIRRRFSPFGGAEKFIMRAIGGLEDQGIHITVISESWEIKSSDPIPKNWNWIKASVTGWSRARKFLSFNHTVSQILQSNHFDLIQSHERLVGADIYRLGDGIHASWIARLAATSPWYIQLWLKLDPYHRAVIKTEQAMAKDPNLTYVANSRLVKKELIDWYQVPASRIELIENGIDTTSFAPVSPQQKAVQKTQLGLDQNRPVVVFVGSGFMRKGAFELLKAMDILKNFQLIIVGKDKKIDQLKKLSAQLGLEKQVLITGPQSDVKPYLAAADIFCLPSIYDSFPNAVLEALCCGLPVVITDAVGIREAVVDHQAGAICERTPDSIAQTLLKVFDMHDAMSNNALKLSKQYDIHQANQHWIELYQKLTLKKATRS
jgi:glycosyltransferase involved in cell wall biosynthesis